ncbi:copine-8-like [Oppia nitens]|uniref:copine-8-like n=1 Tax=Oppia nitens TaxID=1686743 RepID=UPI0023DC041F|nr:copine-8-like [Oppia nitens]
MGMVGQAEMPTSLVELSIACRNLINADILSKSDPQVIVFIRNDWQERYYELGRTEMIADNLNPDFVKRFQLSYSFECVQRLKFEVWDIDPKIKIGSLEIYDTKNDFLGQYETTLAEIVAHQGRQLIAPLTGVKGRKNCGQIVLLVEEVAECKHLIRMSYRASSLKRTRFWSRLDPFLVFSRANEDSTWTVVHKTECLHKNFRNNKEWQPIVLKSRTLCNGDYDRAIRIQVFDDRFSGQHKLIGDCFTSLSNIVKGPGPNNVYDVINRKRSQKSSSYRNSGRIVLTSIAVEEEYSFLDYIRSGTQLHFAVAVDFTASNGDPRDPNSLHYFDIHGKPNCYEMALKAVGDIIAVYNRNGVYPAYGFGAKIPPINTVSHQFPINGNLTQPYCSGIDEILRHYRTTLSAVTLYGPTNFAPVINNTAAIARQYQSGHNYFVLLIITDGIISDIHATKSAIIAAASLPLSIIIIGVGNADFDAMDELDGDDVRVNVDGRYAERDIVQFVPINRFLTRSGPSIRSKADLAREVLYEIPEQLTGYMKSKGFRPNRTNNDQ